MDEEDAHQGDKRLIVITTIVLSIALILIWINLVNNPGEPEPGNIPADFRLPGDYQKYVLSEGLPKGFELFQVNKEFYYPETGLNYHVIKWSYGSDLYNLGVNLDEKEAHVKFMNYALNPQDTDYPGVKRIYNPRKAYFWNHGENLLVLLNEKGEVDAHILEFFLDEFPATP